MAIEKDVLDRLLAGRDPDEVFARGGLLDNQKKALSERILNAELDAHLDGERAEHAVAARPANRRNGTSPKTVLTGRLQHQRRSGRSKWVLCLRKVPLLTPPVQGN